VYAPNGPEVPLTALSAFSSAMAPLAVTHQGLFPAVTISFNLRPGVARGDAVNAIDGVAGKASLLPTIHTGLRALLRPTGIRWAASLS
jgi:multidrug efflux pump subunit AcrB